MKAFKTTIRNAVKLDKEITNEDDKLSAILSSMGEGLIMIDQDSKVVLMNQAAGTLLRVAPAEGIGQNIHALFAFYRGRKKIESQDSAISIATREASTINIRLEDDIFCENKLGQLFPLTMTVTGLLNYGDIKGVIIFNDITREKEIDRMKTEFVSVVSHQLRTPLAAIKLFAEMLGEEDIGKLNKKQQDYLEHVQKSTTRMIDLVNELLNVSRLESGRLRIRTELIDLEELIQSIVEEVKVLAKVKNCSIIFHKPKENDFTVPVDSSLLVQVIRNLIVNAVRYSLPKSSSHNPLSSRDGQISSEARNEDEGVYGNIRRGGMTKPQSKFGNRSGIRGYLTGSKKCSVEVVLERIDDNFVISVQDHGIGIPKDIQSRIFERFFRADNAQKAEAEGTGLGLYVARMLIEASGGKIWFESAGINKGTAFYVTIPVSGMKEKKGEKGVSGA